MSTQTALPAVLADLADRYDRLADNLAYDMTYMPVPSLTGDAQEAGRVTVYRHAARDIREVLATGRIPTDLLMASEQDSR